MECDSMHCSIEHAQKHMKIYTVNDWENVMRGARRHNPYITQEVKYRNFYDLKQLARTTIMNTRKNEEGKSVNWLEIRCLRFRKDSPHQIFHKTSFVSTDWSVLRQTVRHGRRKTSLIPGYETPIPISSAKKCDLMSLCTSGVIPAIYHDYFSQLSCTESTVDFTAEPAVEDSDVDSS